LGGRLQDARRARGLTQQAVADRLGVARTTLVAIEKGERRIVPDELIKLAAIYGRPVSEFVTKQAVVEGFVPQFRASWKDVFVEDSELEESASELQRLAEDYLELERLCNMPPVRAYPLPYDISGASAEQIAEEMRRLKEIGWVLATAAKQFARKTGKRCWTQDFLFSDGV